MKTLVAVVIILLVAVGGYYYLNKPNAQENLPSTASLITPPPPTQVPNTPVTATPDSTAAHGVVFTITGANYSFTPSTLTIKKGDQVKITFVNSGGMHDFKIDEFNVATKRIKSGEQDVVEFTANKAGTFEYYCSVGTHRAMGMKGTLTVTE